MKTIFALAFLVSSVVSAATPAEISQWFEKEAAELINLKTCDGLRSAIAILTAEEALRVKYPGDFKDRRGILASMKAELLRTCKADRADQDCGKLGSDITISKFKSGAAGGGQIFHVPPVALAYSYLSPEQRKEFEAVVPADLKEELETYLESNEEMLEELGGFANGEKLLIETKDGDLRKELLKGNLEFKKQPPAQ